MSMTARYAISAWRNEAREFNIRVRGVDLTNVPLRGQVRLAPDTPGAPLIDLGKVTEGQGIRLDRVTVIDGLPESELRIRIEKTTVQALPYAGELGDNTILAYAIQFGETTRLAGDFVVLASAIDSDNAPTGRTGSGGSSGNQPPLAGVSLTIAEDDSVTLSVDGIDLLAPLVAAAQQAAREAAEAATALAREAMTPAPIGGDLDGGVPSGAGSWLIEPPKGSVKIATQPELLARDVRSTVTLKPGEEVALSCEHIRSVIDGDFVLGGCIVVKTSDGTYPRISVVNVTASASAAQRYEAANAQDLRAVENITTNIRRYAVGGTVAAGEPLRSSYIHVQNTTNATVIVAAFALGASARQYGDIDYRDYDPATAAELSRRLLDVEGGSARPLPIGGNLPGGILRSLGEWLEAPTIVQATDPTLLAAGIEYEAKVDDTAGSARDGVYVRVNVRPAFDFGNLDYVVASVVVRKQPADSWDQLTGDWLNVSTLQVDNRQPQPIAPSTGAILRYEDLAANIRRYWIRQRYTKLDGRISWMIIFPRKVEGKLIHYSGFALALSHVPAGNIDWTNWTADGLLDIEQKLDVLEDQVGQTDQPHPDMLVQSSYHVLQGMPLRLTRDGLTAYRERTSFDIAALGRRGPRPGESWASPQMALDGLDFEGAGFFRAKRRGRDEQALWQVPTTFFSASATGTGEIRHHQIGDSLSNDGMIGAVRDQLGAAGMSPAFIGTLRDQTGGLGEGRPNWMAANYVWAAKKPNNPGRGMIYDLFPLRPNGGSGVTIAVQTSAGAVTSASASGGTGYPDGVWEVVFQNQSDNGDGTRRARGRITVSGGVPGAITIDDGGAGYVGTVSASIAASYDEYKAMGDSGSYGPRWHYNPYLRPATQSEASANDPRIRNGQIFDFGHYIQTFAGGVMPTHVTICLGMNDLWGGGGTAQTAFAAIRQIVQAVRGASASLPIAVAIPGQATQEIWTQFVALTKLLMAEYRGKEAEGFFILPLFQVADAKFVYSVTGASATDAQTGQQTVSIADPTHPNEVGRRQMASMIFAWIMNRR